MLNTPAKFTRLELGIIVAAMVVLIFSNRPPESGNAGIRPDLEPAADLQTPIPTSQPEGLLPPDTTRPGSISAGNSQSDNPAVTPLPQPRPRAKRIAKVDARQWNPLKYPNIMYGEVTVSRVWNGTTFEWRTVCEVREKDGTTSIWDFDKDKRHEGVIVSELPPDPASTY